jgi:hypothetical protein
MVVYNLDFRRAFCQSLRVSTNDTAPRQAPRGLSGFEETHAAQASVCDDGGPGSLPWRFPNRSIRMQTASKSVQLLSKALHFPSIFFTFLPRIEPFQGLAPDPEPKSFRAAFRNTEL